MKNKLLLPALLSVLLTLKLTGGAGQTYTRERLSLDKGWLFHLGDIPFPAANGHYLAYITSKAGSATGAAAPEYDDRDWKNVQVPHDWAIEQAIDSTENLAQGFHARGFGWYRRTFKLPVSDKGKQLELQFDGIATYSTVWVNGTLVNRNWCGYTSSYIDITALAKFGDEVNTIAVRVDANAHEGWWYEGAGIYRHAWLVKRSPLHIVTDGVYANPVKRMDGNWDLPAEVTLANTGKSDGSATVRVTVYDQNGTLVTDGETLANVSPLHRSTVSIPLQVRDPVLWELVKPTLYQVKTTLVQDGHMVDELDTKCGFRTIRFTADSGFYLNNKHVKIQGVCNHQDHAGVGVALPDALFTFRLKKLKEMGVNAYRCSHHPPAVEFLNDCDSLGIMVMDENRNFNTAPENIEQLEWMVRRDRNHPSIILWSVFNEEPMQGTENGYEMVRIMNARVKDLDTTRPVTAAMNGGLFAPVNVAQAVDVVGFNYQIGSYDRFHQENPTMKLTSTEDVSAFQTRGEYVTDKSKNIIDAYDSEAALWGVTHRKGWKAIAERPYLAGAFVWTGFDYRGEPTPFKWPSAGSFFGAMDQCGFPKTAYWQHQAQWRKDITVLQLVPHWNWPVNMTSKKIRVMALSNVDSIALWLNGKVLGGQKADPYEMNTWEVPYQPGKLEAVGFRGGREVARFRTETTGEPVSLQLIPDGRVLANDGRDAMTFTVQALDRKGRAVPTANLPVSFEVTGGHIIGLGNGDPNSHEAEKGDTRKLFNGLAQVIIQADEGSHLPVRIIARSKGLKSAGITVAIQEVPAVPFVPVVQPVFQLEQWRVSAVSTSRPDPNKQIDENDMNSWAPAAAGQLQDLAGGRYLVYRTVFQPYEAQRRSGGVIVIQKLTGKAEVWLSGKLIATKTDAAPADLNINFPAVPNKALLSILIEAEPGSKAGLGGLVSVRPLGN